MKRATTEDKLVHRWSSELPSACSVHTMASVTTGGVFCFAKLDAAWNAASEEILAGLSAVFCGRGEVIRAGESLMNEMKRERILHGPLGFHVAHNPEGLHVTLDAAVAVSFGRDPESAARIYMVPERIKVLANS
jgi:hypothetical protein